MNTTSRILSAVAGVVFFFNMLFQIGSPMCEQPSVFTAWDFIGTCGFLLMVWCAGYFSGGNND